jgi:hypothetical protein
VRDREFGALLEAARKHRKAELHIIVLNADAARGVPKPIQVHNAAMWFLDRQR